MIRYSVASSLINKQFKSIFEANQNFTRTANFDLSKWLEISDMCVCVYVCVLPEMLQ